MLYDSGAVDSQLMGSATQRNHSAASNSAKMELSGMLEIVGILHLIVVYHFCRRTSYLHNLTFTHTGKIVIDFGPVDTEDRGAVAASLGGQEYTLTFGSTCTEAEGKFLATLLEVNPNLLGIDLDRDVVFEMNEDADFDDNDALSTDLGATAAYLTNWESSADVGTTTFLNTGTGLTGLVGGSHFGLSASAGRHSEVPEAISHLLNAFLVHKTWHELDVSNFA